MKNKKEPSKLMAIPISMENYVKEQISNHQKVLDGKYSYVYIKFQGDNIEIIQDGNDDDLVQCFIALFKTDNPYVTKALQIITDGMEE